MGEEIDKYEVVKSVPAGNLAAPVSPLSFLLDVYQSFEESELLEQIDWLVVDSSSAYRALGLGYFEKHADRIRSDLNEEFRSLQAESAAKSGLSHDILMQSAKWSELESFIRSRFSAAALAILAERGQKEDLDIARNYLSEGDKDTKYDVWCEAIRVVERFGDDSDLGRLLAIAEDSFGKLQELAASAALKLTSDKQAVCNHFFGTGNNTLAVLAVKSMLDQDSESSRQFIEARLHNQHAQVRLLAVAYFAKVYEDESQFEKLLARYIRSPSYYYNVVVWLDRLLYAPDPFKEAYKGQLDRRLKVTDFFSGLSQLFG